MTTPCSLADVVRPGQSQLLVVSLLIGSQLCGLPASVVRDVLGPQPITPVPLAPVEIAGNLNIRGRIVTAIDLRVRLGLGTRDQLDQVSAMAVVTEHGSDVYALLVDRVLEVIALDPDTVTSLPPNLAPTWSEVGRGVCRVAEGWLIMLDIGSLLALQPKAA